MQKYFIKKIINDSVSFLPEDEHHIIKVMRLKEKDQVIAIDKNGNKFLVALTSLIPLRAQIVEKLIEDTTNPFELNVFQPTIKPSHLETAIQKACELNVSNFYIFNSELSQGNIKHNLSRYEKIIKEACEQSNRNKLMNIEIINSQERLVQLLNQNDINLIAHFTDQKVDLEKELSTKTNKIGIIVGPEGGLTEKDLKLMCQSQNRIINLTKTILRSETATIYLCSVVSYVLLKVFKNE